MSLATLHREIVACTRCARLRAHCADVAAVKRAAYRDETYWGRPLPGFGDPEARLLVVGLAPGAHGANRTGRMFTGDRSGLFLMTAMHAAGFASHPDLRVAARRPDAARRLDHGGGALRAAGQQADAAGVRRLPARSSKRSGPTWPACGWSSTLGKLAWDSTWRVLAGRGQGLRPRPAFGHGASVLAPEGGPLVLGAFHPSQQNTFTGRLTPEMLARVFHDARAAVR